MLAIAALALCAAAGPAAAGSGSGSDPSSGEWLYLHGVLESGKPVEAVVAGDVAITGEQVSCASCHGRSGMGSIEGRRLAPPVTTEFLDGPRKLRSRPRPAYRPETLARAIREGVDAGGNRLDRLMPRYRLDARSMKSLQAYLRTLTTQPSPGASNETLELATVIAPGVPAASERTALSVLTRYIETKNAGQRDLRARHLSSWPEYFGEWNLQVWRLSGPPSGWRAQLEEHYRARPVFALLSGLGGDEWSAVNGFCQDKRLPCLLPNVETPPEEALNEYSLYFDGGVLTEARGIAVELDKLRPARVLQVFRASGARAAAALATALPPGVSSELPLGDEPLDAGLAQACAEGAAAVVLWLGAGDLQRLAPDTFAGSRVFVSATLLGGEVDRAPAFLDGFAALPGALPDDASRRFARVAGWMKSRGLSPAGTLEERRIADRTLFAATTLSEGVMHLHKYLLRDYLLEVIDHLTGLEEFSASFPRLSFGPGQRVLSKGCWLVPLRAGGRAPEWVVP